MSAHRAAVRLGLALALERHVLLGRLRVGPKARCWSLILQVMSRDCNGLTVLCFSDTPSQSQPPGAVHFQGITGTQGSTGRPRRFARYELPSPRNGSVDSQRYRH
ncbi:hypothetical protein F5Y15DRAFT_39232 [Xylariaceae sp. FL0016]|nr:hypothetical protein F5Y15DRAFT_39232 [Xylariaceae sp. FL0016]